MKDTLVKDNKNPRLALSKNDLLDFLVIFSLNCMSEEEASKISLSVIIDFIDRWIEANDNFKLH